ncbi:MAG TPA: nucleotide exchange factor GrpE [Vicinamibacterales bacterium]|nr:nucleotide exchange factor GrpE [Vicinamibacterales bacterium]
MTEKEATEPVDPSVTDREASSTPDAGTDQLTALRREADEMRDRWLRKTAEFDNYRKRIERERREQSDQAVTDVLEALLPVVDDFDRALTIEAGPEADAYRKGVELIHAKLQDMLKKRGVRPIEALGADFDPNVHQAVMHEASPGHRDGEVIGELQKGYMLGDKLLRPAMVKVAKA